jgi:hypothetical protein
MGATRITIMHINYREKKAWAYRRYKDEGAEADCARLARLLDFSAVGEF